MRGVTTLVVAGRPACRKHFAPEDTREYMCFGSGAGNEIEARRWLGDVVPEVWSLTRLPDGGEVVVMEACAGEQLDLASCPEPTLQAVGAMLGRIHSVQAEHFGSLDGAFTYETQDRAFAPRWDVALRLLGTLDAPLARRLEEWGRPAIATLTERPPRLVHGDFGPSNLLERPDGTIVVLDWEHARFGDFREDWAKIELSRRFAEPNGFSLPAPAWAAVRHGWAETVELDLAVEPVPAVYLAYYAATLGVFFRDPDRLRWLAELIG